MDQTKYSYAVGRIRAIEKRLLSKEKYDRMIEAKSPEDVFKMLADSGYGSGNNAWSQTLYGYEGVLKEEMSRAYGLLKEIAPEPGFFDLFLLRNDYHNLRVLVKAELSGSFEEDIIIGPGTIQPEELKTLIRERKFTELPEIMKRALEDCFDTYNKTMDPQVIDLILDRASYAHMLEEAHKTRNGFLIKLVKMQIDLANIKIFLRVKAIGGSINLLGRALLDGGTLAAEFYLNHFDEDLESFGDSIRGTPYGGIFYEGLESYKVSGSFFVYEKLADNFIISFVRQEKYKVFGVEPLVGYLLAKEYEIMNVRIIIVGKINNIPNQTVRERLRETYV